MSHTPTPWSRNIKPASKYPTIWSGRNTHVAYVKSGGGLSEAEVEANMEFIIKAVNSYQAMKEALEEALQSVENWACYCEINGEGKNNVPAVVARHMKQALTLANGKDKEP